MYTLVKLSVLSNKLYFQWTYLVFTIY